MAQRDDDRDDEGTSSKGAVLQEARVFNDPQLDPRRCSQVSGNTLFMTGDFKELKLESHANDTWDEQKAMTSTADYLASIDNSADSGSYLNSDLQLAIAVQQQEFEPRPQRQTLPQASSSGSSRLVTGPQQQQCSGVGASTSHDPPPSFFEQITGTFEERQQFDDLLKLAFAKESKDFKIPIFYNENINCLKLWRAIQSFGGIDEVIRFKLFGHVSKCFDLYSCTSPADRFRKLYNKSIAILDRRVKNGDAEIQVLLARWTYPQLPENMQAEINALVKRGENIEIRFTRCKGEAEDLQVPPRMKKITAFQEHAATQQKRCLTKDQIREFDNLFRKAIQLEEKCSSQEEQIKTMHEKLQVYEQIIIEGEIQRKQLHNTIMELKGNIRVFCRVRPLLPDDGAGTEANAISYPTSTESIGRGIDLMQGGKKHSFTFDKVLMPHTSQEDVFVEISELIQSALDGYRVCIFAYGQTGSGKTYTMMGRPGNSEHKGLIPRSLEKIFQTRQSFLTQGWKYELKVSMLEIYNETIRDLLSINRPYSDASLIDNSTSSKKCTLKQDAHGNTFVSDLTYVDVRSSEEVSFLLDQAAQIRSVGKTQMNEQSSRSHFVLMLQISGGNESTEQQVQGFLNLIDLAGSERLSKSGATGDRLKETQAINKSLSSLSDVISALAKKEAHVPFRNSKLTRLLQPCLGGDSKTLMFLNVSSNPSSTDESLCSLRFADRVNVCRIGR